MMGRFTMCFKRRDGASVSSTNTESILGAKIPLYQRQVEHCQLSCPVCQSMETHSIGVDNLDLPCQFISSHSVIENLLPMANENKCYIIEDLQPCSWLDFMSPSYPAASYMNSACCTALLKVRYLSAAQEPTQTLVISLRLFSSQFALLLICLSYNKLRMCWRKTQQEKPLQCCLQATKR